MSSVRERTFLLVTAGLLLVLGLDSLVLTPLGNATSRLREEREKLEGDLLSSQSKLQKRRSLSQRWNRWLGSTLRKDPSEAERQILNAVRQWAKDAGVNLASIQPERPSQKGEVREIRFGASSTGPFGSLVRFLCSLETADIPVRIQRLELRPAKGAADQLALDLRFSTLYVVPEKGKTEQPPAAEASKTEGRKS